MRAASLINATRSGESHRPWAKASAIPRLPRSSFGHVRGESIQTVAAGAPEPYDAPLVALDDDQAADRDPPQQERHEPASEPGAHARPACGWRWTGTPASFSPSACA